MRPVLVDSSAWIEYFRGGNGVNSVLFDNLIDENQI